MYTEQREVGARASCEEVNHGAFIVDAVRTERDVRGPKFASTCVFRALALFWMHVIQHLGWVVPNACRPKYYYFS